MSVHPTAVIYGDLELAEGAVVGPYCFIQGRVSIGAHTVVQGHVSIGCKNATIKIGRGNELHPGAVIGGPPQDLGYKGEETELIIGDENVFREFSTVNIATSKENKKTIVGNKGYFMSYTHIGHDCIIGDHVTIANNTHLGGHCRIESHTVIGGMCAFNQFTHVGEGAFIAGGSIVNKDILPYSRAQGNHAVMRATNKVGLLRRGVSREDIENVHRAIRIVIMGAETMEQAIKRIREECKINAQIEYLIQFILNSKRGIAKE